MMTLLTTYAVPLIGTAILGLFAKPSTDKPVIWKRILESFVKPSTPSTTSPSSPLPDELLKLLPSLLDQLFRKPPPVSPDEPLPAVPDPKSPQDILTYILSRLALQTSPQPDNPDVELILPEDREDKLASLVAVANDLAESKPEFDYFIAITTDGGVDLKKVKRDKPE